MINTDARKSAAMYACGMLIGLTLVFCYQYHRWLSTKLLSEIIDEISPRYPSLQDSIRKYQIYYNTSSKDAFCWAEASSACHHSYLLGATRDSDITTMLFLLAMAIFMSAFAFILVSESFSVITDKIFGKIQSFVLPETYSPANFNIINGFINSVRDVPLDDTNVETGEAAEVDEAMSPVSYATYRKPVTLTYKYKGTPISNTYSLKTLVEWLGTQGHSTDLRSNIHLTSSWVTDLKIKVNWTCVKILAQLRSPRTASVLSPRDNNAATPSISPVPN